LLSRHIFSNGCILSEGEKGNLVLIEHELDSVPHNDTLSEMFIILMQDYSKSFHDFNNRTNPFLSSSSTTPSSAGAAFSPFVSGDRIVSGDGMR
jgi:hypothetical protein